MRVPLRRSSPPETDKPSRFAANRSPRSRSTRTPRDSRRSIPGRSVPDTIFQSAFGVLDALLQPAFGNLPLQPFATMVGPQRPSCRIQFPLSVPETLGANLNAPAHARSRLVGHAAHLTAIAQLSCRHRYHLVAIGLQRQPLRGILRDLSRSKMLGIRIVLDRQARLAVTEVGDECFPFGDLARFFARPHASIHFQSGEGIAAITMGNAQHGQKETPLAVKRHYPPRIAAPTSLPPIHAAQRCGGQTTRCDVSRSKAFYCPVRCAMTGRRRTSRTGHRPLLKARAKEEQVRAARSTTRGNLHTRRQRCERTASPDRDKSTHELLPGERCFCDDRVRARDKAAESEGKSSPDKQPSAPSGHTASMHLFPQRSLTTAGKGPTANTRMRMCRRERIACRAV